MSSEEQSKSIVYKRFENESEFIRVSVNQQQTNFPELSFEKNEI